jgi:hypothetical protein
MKSISAAKRSSVVSLLNEGYSHRKGKGGSYKVLDHKLIESQITAPMIDYFV